MQVAYTFPKGVVYPFLPITLVSEIQTPADSRAIHKPKESFNLNYVLFQLLVRPNSPGPLAFIKVDKESFSLRVLVSCGPARRLCLIL